MPKIPLSDLKIQQLKPGEYWDAKFPAFGVRVGVNTKTFLLKKNNSRIKLGSYPATTLSQARMKAHGLKPSTAASHPLEMTLRDAIDLFLAQHCKSYRPRSLAEITRLLGKLRPLEDKKLSAVTTQQVHDLIDPLPSSEANHLFKACRTLFRFCVRRRIGPNPLEGLSLPNKERSRARVLTDEELGRIWRACSQTELGETTNPARLHEPPHRLPASFCTIVQLLILTGQRRGEIAALQSSWVKDNKITLPKEIAKNGRQHTIPISALSAEILALPVAATPEKSSMLFGVNANGSFRSFTAWSKNKTTLDKLSGVTNWTLHDIRRTVASNMGALGIRLEVIERILNHVSGSFGGVAGTYQRYEFMPEMRDAIERWEARLLHIVR